jgi:hypothetical protein
VLVTALVLAGALIVVLSGYFSSHDSGAVSVGADVGTSFPSLGDGKLAPGQSRPRYNSNPPTSGAHIPVTVRRDRVTLSVDELLSALAAGDVVIDYGGPRPPAGLQTLANRLAGRFSPALATAGQAVLLARRPGTVGLIALAWTRAVTVSGPNAPLLRAFVQTWLGAGAPGH